MRFYDVRNRFISSGVGVESSPACKALSCSRGVSCLMFMVIPNFNPIQFCFSVLPDGFLVCDSMASSHEDMRGIVFSFYMDTEICMRNVDSGTAL